MKPPAGGLISLFSHKMFSFFGKLCASATSHNTYTFKQTEGYRCRSQGFCRSSREVSVLVFSAHGDSGVWRCGGPVFAGTDYDGEPGKTRASKLSLYGSVSKAWWAVGEYSGARRLRTVVPIGIPSNTSRFVSRCGLAQGNLRHGLELDGGGSGTRRSLLLRVGQYWRSRFPPNFQPKSTA